ncbi:PEP-CTERM sorting domain-containing protein [Roseateles sp.]|uniref:PEP-CTERM sorting domain-containing protein n=1 Tax=Roseateles sp. TaxID=1971397 RepID=UPI0025D98AA1|nr:PEP-CTERM sorting domain-containing protein [Roseateles sp.]MBV8035636.1 PEP-CTERM sorting domain-containing protein [Roseateles sp.]
MTRLNKFVLAIATAAVAQMAHAAPIALTNAGFEAEWTGVASAGSDGYVTFNYSPTGPAVGWSFGAGTGVAGAYGLLAAFEGSHFALLQGASNPMSQTFSLADAMNVSLSFELALRPNYGTGQVVRVSVDGQTVGEATAETGWHLHTLNLGMLSMGTHELAFQGLSGSVGDTTAFLDDVRLDGQASRALPEPASLPMTLLAAGMGLVAWRRRAR